MTVLCIRNLLAISASQLVTAPPLPDGKLASEPESESIPADEMVNLGIWWHSGSECWAESLREELIEEDSCTKYGKKD